MNHAPLPPSGAPQWANCSGSLLAGVNSPRLDTDASRAGTAAHWVVSECLSNFRTTDTEVRLACGQWVGQTAPNGVVIDATMAEGAQAMVDDVLRVAQEHGAMQDLLIEHRVHMPQIHAENWGTLDAALPVLSKKLLYLWDYKHGNREVRARGNFQLIDYLAGLYNEMTIEDDTVIVFRIVHPFCYTASAPVSEWRVEFRELQPYFNQLAAKAEEATTKPSMSTGPWCRDCAAVGTCSVLRRSIYGLTDYVNVPCGIDVMDNASLAAEYAILKAGSTVLEARLEAVEDNLAHRISQGAVDTGLALGTKPGRLAWKIPVEQAVALAAQFGIDAAKPGVLTPTQTKDAAPPELRAAVGEVLKTVAFRPAGKLKLIDADDTIGARAFKPKGKQ